MSADITLETQGVADAPSGLPRIAALHDTPCSGTQIIVQWTESVLLFSHHILYLLKVPVPLKLKSQTRDVTGLK